MSSAELIAFRTACNAQIGLGHLRRCLTLAGALHRRGAQPRFWVAGGGPLELVEKAGFPARAVPPEAETACALAEAERVAAVVVDDYGADAAFFRTLGQAGARVIAIDDLGDRELDVDAVLNACANAAELPDRARPGSLRLLGARYALLRPEITEPRGPGARPTPDEPARVLVTLGGSDPLGQTAQAVAAARAALPEARLDVVIGPLAREPELPPALRGDPRITLVRAPERLDELMRAADLAISAGGQTTYELAALGVPTVALCVADNQRGSLRALAEVPTLLPAGDDLLAAVRRLAGDAPLRARMREAGPQLVDGRGAERVAEAILSLIANHSVRTGAA